MSTQAVTFGNVSSHAGFLSGLYNAFSGLPDTVRNYVRAAIITDDADDPGFIESKYSGDVTIQMAPSLGGADPDGALGLTGDERLRKLRHLFHSEMIAAGIPEDQVQDDPDSAGQVVLIRPSMGALRVAKYSPVVGSMSPPQWTL